MPSLQSAFSLLQKIGKCMMLPVSVLPVAGILLGVGSANFSWLPDTLSQVMSASGSAIFSNLPLLFAIGVAIGLTDNDGVAALAGAVGFVVFLAALGVFAGLLGIETKPIMGIASIETGVFGGVIVGLVAAAAFNRFYRLQLPSYLGFFAGKRSVPIVTAFAVILLGAVLSLVWPPIGGGIDRFSHWAVHGRPALAFTIYGVVERALIPFGLHHVWNVPFFFQAGTFTDPNTGAVVHGEIARFVAGDPTAGHMTGGYLFKMWGLPGAAFAMWHAARPSERKKVGGIMISAALTAFLTGITEPIGRLSEAIHAATHERFEGAILDMNLNGEIVYPLAELLTQQRVPFLFVTGYAPGSLDPRFTQVPILQKPVVQDELAGALDLMLKVRREAALAAMP